MPLDENPSPTSASANTIASAALSSGDTTSEHAAMKSSALWGRLMTIAGVLLAGIPQLISMLSSTGIADTKPGAIILAVLGGLMAILGTVKETNTKIAYIQGRSTIKAAAVRDLDTTGS